jgi:alanine racemase
MASTETSTLRSVRNPQSWVEVSLNALRRNFRTIQAHVGDEVSVCVVVKADAYGHGAAQCSAALVAEGTPWLGVASVDEGAALREAGINRRILLMAGFWRGDEDEIIRLSLTPTVWESWQIETLNRAAERSGTGRFPVHLKIDSGMGRLGVTRRDLGSIIDLLKAAKYLWLEGVSSHLASSEVVNGATTEEQLRNFEECRRLLETAGLQPKLVHVANTSAIIAHRQAWNNMVRAGLGLYGYYLPFRCGEDEEGQLRLNVEPVLTWKTRVLTVREVGPNQALGYGGTYTTESAARIAVLPVGYSDGLNRALSSKGRVIVRGQYAPIVGLISMNLTLVDVTGISGVRVGDEVILLGSSSGRAVTAQDHACLANTISYDILCAISKTVPRKYND